MARGRKSKLVERPKTAKNTHGTVRFSNNTSKKFIHASTSDKDQASSLLTLRDAARHHSGSALWGNSSVNLRDRTVTFVPSEDDDMRVLQGTIKKEPKAPFSTISPQFASNRTIQFPTLANSSTENPSTMLSSLDSDVKISNPDLNLEGSKGLCSDQSISPHLLIHSGDCLRRSLSTSSVSSSEDVILFSGRTRAEEYGATTVRPEKEDATAESFIIAETNSPRKHPFFQQERQVTILPATTTWDNSGVDWVHEKKLSGLVPDPAMEDSDMDEFAADYIQNLKENYMLEDAVSSRFEVKSSSEKDKRGFSSGDIHSRPRMTQPAQYFGKSGWQTSDIHEFDDISTSDEVLETVERVLSKRTRRSGLQYLIVWQGRSIDEAKWIPISGLDMPGAVSLIQEFEDSVEHRPSDSDGSEDDDEHDSNIENGDFLDELSSSDDDWHERDLEERQISRMNDEEIAYLLSKQEELGMGSDELLLFDDSGHYLKANKSSEDDHEGSSSVIKKIGAKVSTKRRKQTVSVPLAFADSFLDGDDYGEFDIMDRNRLSLIGKGTAKSSLFALNISDSDLETSLQESWAADRRKKSLKKREREELRAQGLLGKKNKQKPDLSAKYQDGLSMAQIKAEIEDFLKNSHDTLALPPLDKKERKTIHTIAHSFNLKSKSVGSGRSRFPILYKTSKTRHYDESAFPALSMELHQRFLPRMDRRGKGSRLTARGGNGAPDISYRDGDVVGASAPQIGAENRGHAMLEKMGWSFGTALGALNNKGILEPVSHIVRKSKAGLG